MTLTLAYQRKVCYEEIALIPKSIQVKCAHNLIRNTTSIYVKKIKKNDNYLYSQMIIFFIILLVTIISNYYYRLFIPVN